MTRFSGKVGYGQTVESAPGVAVDQITEFRYFGDVVRNTSKSSEGESVINDLSVNNSISIVADDFANANFMYIRYVVWAGVYWTVDSVDVQRPRLILRLGSVYNGPKPESP